MFLLLVEDWTSKIKHTPMQTPLVLLFCLFFFPYPFCSPRHGLNRGQLSTISSIPPELVSTTPPRDVAPENHHLPIRRPCKIQWGSQLRLVEPCWASHDFDPPFLMRWKMNVYGRPHRQHHKFVQNHDDTEDLKDSQDRTLIIRS